MEALGVNFTVEAHRLCPEASNTTLQPTSGAIYLRCWMTWPRWGVAGGYGDAKFGKWKQGGSQAGRQENSDFGWNWYCAWNSAGSCVRPGSNWGSHWHCDWRSHWYRTRC